MSSPRFALVLITTLLLAACGYGWKQEPNIYPPSAASRAPGQVMGGGSAGAGDYLVQAGDTLYAIGFRNQIDWKDLAAWNGIAGPDYLIRSGQSLRLLAPVAVAGSSAVATRPLAPTVPPPSPQPAVPKPVPADGPTPLPSANPTVPVLSLPPAPVSMPVGVAALRWSWPTVGTVVRGYNLAAGAKGVDIGGEAGQPVLATAAGKVVYSGSALKGYGELVIIKHDDSYLSAYGYNRRRLVKEGDEVRAGQTIAELGIGPEQKPALHFEIREHGKPVDPLRFLPAR